jgi:hypothetical protein
MKLRRYGFFKEFEHGDKNAQSILAICGTAPYTTGQRQQVVAYLDSGVLLFASPGVLRDFLSESPDKIAGTMSILTDGIWAWPSVLSYYVDNYGVPIDSAMFDCMVSNNWKVPEGIHPENLEW